MLLHLMHTTKTYSIHVIQVQASCTSIHPQNACTELVGARQIWVSMQEKYVKGGTKVHRYLDRQSLRLVLTWSRFLCSFFDFVRKSFASLLFLDYEHYITLCCFQIMSITLLTILRSASHKLDVPGRTRLKYGSLFSSKALLEDPQQISPLSYSLSVCTTHPARSSPLVEPLLSELSRIYLEILALISPNR